MVLEGQQCIKRYVLRDLTSCPSLKDGIQLNKDLKVLGIEPWSWSKCSGPRELVYECPRALAGLSEGGHVYLRLFGQYCVGVGTLWSWYTHVCGCEGVGRAAEVHGGSSHQQLCLAQLIPGQMPCQHDFTFHPCNNNSRE